MHILYHCIRHASSQDSLWPAFKRGHCEECQHSVGNVVEVEVLVVPLALKVLRMFNVTIFELDVVPSDTDITFTTKHYVLN